MFSHVSAFLIKISPMRAGAHPSGIWFGGAEAQKEEKRVALVAQNKATAAAERYSCSLVCKNAKILELLAV